MLCKVWTDRGHVYSVLIGLLRCLYYVNSWGVTYFVNTGKDQDFWPRTDPLFPPRGCSLTTNLNLPSVVAWTWCIVLFSNYPDNGSSRRLRNFDSNLRDLVSQKIQISLFLVTFILSILITCPSHLFVWYPLSGRAFHIAHLRQHCNNSKCGIFELLM